MDFKIAIETFEEKFPFLINSSEEFKGQLVFTTIRENQKLAIIKIFLINAKGKFYLNEYKISNIHNAQAGEPKIQISGEIVKNTLTIKIEYNNYLISEDEINIKKYTRTKTGFILLLIAALLIAGVFYVKKNFIDQENNTKIKKERLKENPDTKPVKTEKKIIPVEEEILEVEEITTVEEKKELPPEPIFITKTINKTIYFDPDNFELTSNEINNLKNLINEVKNTTEIKINISGHSAPKGFEKGRKELSEKRAETIKNYLKNQLNNIEISTTAFGDKNPITMEAKDQHLNRRSELLVNYKVEQ